MADDLLTRIGKIASEVLRSDNVEVTPKGEDYYHFSVVAPDGPVSGFPPIWIDPASGDQQIRDKLSHEFLQALYPESAPDDLSVPSLKTEGKSRGRSD